MGLHKILFARHKSQGFTNHKTHCARARGPGADVAPNFSGGLLKATVKIKFKKMTICVVQKLNKHFVQSHDTVL